MKYIIPFLALLITSANAFAQNEIDSALASKITVSGFCLCKTTIDDLQKLSNDLKLVDVEEMDLGKRCTAVTDSRYENGKGYYSEKYPGMIFQKDPDEDYISKIRLTKDFVGQLPDGTPINMKTLLLKDVLKLYPELDNKWGSRDCSDYWALSNDTISFYVKIDTTKKRYPLDEAYYLQKPIDGIDIFISCYSIYTKSDNFSLFASDEPMYFLDSIRVNQGVLKNYQPSEIAMVTVYKDSNAIKLGGAEAKNGLIYITTKEYARDHYRDYFKSKSAEYATAAADDKKEEKAVYILNGKVLSSNFESDLFTIDDTNFVSLKVIDKDNLKKDYHVSGKTFGVVITTK